MLGGKRAGRREGYGADREPQSRPGWMTVVFVLLAVLALGLATARALMGGGEEPSAGPGRVATVTVDETGAQEPAPGASGSAAPPPAAGAMTAQEAATAPCVTPPGDSSALTSAPVGARWEQVEGRHLPKGPSGPTVVGGGVRRCYAHTPEGAAYAIYTVPYMAMVSKDYQLVREHQMTPGPFREQLGALGRGDTDGVAQTVGFRIKSYSPQRVEYETVEEWRGEQWVLGGTLVWSGGDWKWDGSKNPPERRVPDSIEGETGWVAWRG